MFRKNRWKWVDGEPWGICDRCGFKFRLSELQLEWTNYLVCTKCLDPRHPQLDLQGREEKVGVEDARPEPTDNFVERTFTRPYTLSRYR